MEFAILGPLRVGGPGSPIRIGAPKQRAPLAAAELLREALALFRGPPLADAPLYGPGHGEADRLAELRLEPGRELQRLERAILAQDPTLDGEDSPFGLAPARITPAS